MRTNFAGFALSLGMGLIVLLIGFVALSAAGLVNMGPPVEGIATEEEFVCQGEGPYADSVRAANVVRVAVTPQQLDGEALFKNNCTQCHAVNERIVGPALAGITKRRPLPWIVAWVHNPAKLIASSDDYAVKLFQDNAQQQMPAFPQLSANDVEAIMAWIEWQQESATLPGESATVQTVAAR